MDYFHTTDVVVDDGGADGGTVLIGEGGAAPKFFTDRILSLDADGFTVDDAGADDNPNENGTTYSYLAIG